MKIIKWLAIICGVLVIILFLGVMILPFVLPLEKIKDFAIVKISETIEREVKIEKVSLDIFSGIKLQKLYVGNQKGFSSKSFIAADTIELRYAFWPLFSRQLIIKEIRLVKPEILIEKSVRGEFNFADLLKKTKDQRPKTKDDRGVEADKRKTKLPFSLLVNKFSLLNGKLTYVDHSTKSTNIIKNIRVDILGIVLGFFKPIEIKSSATAIYQGKEIPISLTGKVGVNLAKEAIKVSPLSLTLAGESLSLSANIANWKKAPQVDLFLQSKKISLDPFLAIFTALPTETKKLKPKAGELTKTVNKLTASIPDNLKINADIKIDELTFQKFSTKKINLSLSLIHRQVSAQIKEIKIYEGILSGSAKVDLRKSDLSYQISELKLRGFNASPFSNAVIETFLTPLPDYQDLINKVYGILDLSLNFSGRGVEIPVIRKNILGSGTFSLKNGELKRLKTIDAIAEKIKAPSLKRDLDVSLVAGEFAFKDQILNVKNLQVKDTNLYLSFVGGLDLNHFVYQKGNRLTLKASPVLSRDIPQEFNLFRDEKGWFELAFELTGKLKMPIPVPILEKPIEKAVGKLKLKIEAEKLEIEEKVKEEVEQKKEELKKSAEEAKEKLKEEAKQKLKEMFKF